MLPKYRHQVIKTTLPSSGRKVSFSPMSGRDEKVLLMAKESGEDQEILTVVKQVVQNCLLDEVDVNTLPIVDVEWMFVQIRINSVSPTSEVSYIDSSDNKRYDFSIDLTKIDIVKPLADMQIKIDEQITIGLRWPTADAFIKPEIVAAKTEAESVHEIAVSCIDAIYEGDVIYKADDTPREELDDFVLSLPNAVYTKLLEFVTKVPRLEHKINYTNSKGEEREVVLSNLTDFFRFR